MYIASEELLGPARRLALAYAPQASRRAIDVIWLLDARLAKAAMGASDPIIAQLKLAWWRDRFAAPDSAPAVGEPLLEELAALAFPSAELAKMVDAWELFAVAERPSAANWQQWAEGRGAGWAAAAELLAGTDWHDAAQRAGRRWALAEHAGHLADGPDRTALFHIAQNMGSAPERFPRSLRSFAVLDALACRSIRRRESPLADPAAMAVAMRVGIFGR